jgi:hypothetical protein
MTLAPWCGRRKGPRRNPTIHAAAGGVSVAASEASSFGHLRALFLKLGFMREGVAHPGFESGQPVRDFGDRPPLFGELDVEPAECRFEAGDETERRHIMLAKDRVALGGANEPQLQLVEMGGPSLDGEAPDHADGQVAPAPFGFNWRTRAISASPAALRSATV